jgi:hypothetical protein
MGPCPGARARSHRRGETLDDLPSGPSSRFDKANVLHVRLDHGALTSVSDLALLSGANAAAIEHTPGHWEVIQFREAALVGPSTYALSILIRGQQGTEVEISDVLPAGARFVLLDAALTQLDLGPDEIGLPLNWRFGPSNRDLGSPSYDTAVHAFAGIGRRPFAPAHVRGRRDDGDLHISWIRRTRIGGDSWESAEVPVGEDSEHYEIDVLDGDTILRTLMTSSSTAVYTAADQVADFGSPPPAVTVRICQLSASHGRGSPAVAIL